MATQEQALSSHGILAYATVPPKTSAWNWIRVSNSCHDQGLSLIQAASWTQSEEAGAFCTPPCLLSCGSSQKRSPPISKLSYPNFTCPKAGMKEGVPNKAIWDVTISLAAHPSPDVQTSLISKQQENLLEV
jgi:hypothetical protein